LSKNILVDGGSGLLNELLLDAARIIEALAQPEQEPVAWGWAIMHSDGTYARIRPRIADFFGSIQERDPYTSDDAKHADREWAGLAPHTIVTLHTSTPQRKPLTDEEIGKIAGETLDPWSCARVIEAAHGIKENT
jgi:hypothetical protein